MILQEEGIAWKETQIHVRQTCLKEISYFGYYSVKPYDKKSDTFRGFVQGQAQVKLVRFEYRIISSFWLEIAGLYAE